MLSSHVLVNMSNLSSDKFIKKPSMSQVFSGTLVSLQIGRGIAALLVSLFHAGALIEINCGYTPVHGALAFGYAGVDFFFVLSGFIIFRRHIRDRGQPEKLVDFGWRRVVRIYPVYWLVTLAVLPVHFLVPTYGKGDELTVHAIITSLALVPTQQAPILVAGWTLIHEMWFYLLFACLIGVRGQWLRWVLGLWCACAAAFALAVIDPKIIVCQPWLRLIFSPFNFEFVLGCFAGWLVGVPRLQNVSPRIWQALVIGGVLLYLLAAASRLPVEIVGNRVMLMGLIAFLVVLGSAGNELGDVSRIGKNRRVWTLGLVLLGDASYSLYLLHVPTLSAGWKAAEVLGLVKVLGPLSTGLLIVIGCVVLSCLFHLWIEKPLVQKLRMKRLSLAANRSTANNLPR